MLVGTDRAIAIDFVDFQVTNDLVISERHSVRMDSDLAVGFDRQQRRRELIVSGFFSSLVSASAYNYSKKDRFTEWLPLLRVIPVESVTKGGCRLLPCSARSA